MTSQPQKTGTIYRFIRVPDQINNANTVVLIKSQQNPESIARVQKINNNQTVQTVKLSTENVLSNEKKIKTRRDDYRRFQHNQIERARREKINNWIMELGKIIDDNASDDDNDNINTKNGSSGEALSKGGILEKACEYISHLKSIIKEQRHSSSEEMLHEELRRLQDENDKLKVENAMLKRKYEIDDIEDDEILLKRSKTDPDVFSSLIEFSDSLQADDDIAP